MDRIRRKIQEGDDRNLAIMWKPILLLGKDGYEAERVYIARKRWSTIVAAVACRIMWKRWMEHRLQPGGRTMKRLEQAFYLLHLSRFNTNRVNRDEEMKP